MLDQKEIKEIHSILVEWFIKNDKTPADVMGFLTAIWIGQMRLNGYKEEFVDATLEKMKKDWENKHL